MINYVDKMADALVDVLKYSNQDVEWVEPDDMKPNDGVQPEWFYPAIENAEYSEITAILQYTQQEAVFEDEIGELMLGIAFGGNEALRTHTGRHRSTGRYTSQTV